MKCVQKPLNFSLPNEMAPCNFTNSNLHNYSAKIFIAGLVLFSQTNPRQLFNEFAFDVLILHYMRN